MKTIEERSNDYISKVTGCECEEQAGREASVSPDKPQSLIDIL